MAENLEAFLPLSWRPEKRARSRLVTAAGNVATDIIEQKKSGWDTEREAFLFLTGLMAGVDITKQEKEKRTVLAGFFDQAMYANRFLDPLLLRLQHGLKSYNFLEKFWAVDKRVSALINDGQEAGYNNESLATINDWFSLNKVLNLASKQAAVGGNLDEEFWQQFRGEEGSGPEKEAVESIALKVREVFESLPEDKTTQAIIFRSLSSAGFARTLLALSLNRPLNQSAEDQARLRRMASMVMVAQVFDDVGSPAKDVKGKILGIASSQIKEKAGSSFEKGLTISEQETTRVVKLTRQILGACLEIMEIDPQKKLKEQITFWGLVALGASVLPMSGEYGGSYYPLITTAGQVATELVRSLRKETSQDEEKIKNTVKEALGLAIKATC